MRIRLTKKIKVKQIEVIAEVDFYNKKSPYIALLKDFNHQYELEDSLNADGLSAPAIKNIIKKLEDLGILKNDGSISSLTLGFPETEFGKYQITYYHNQDTYPFIFHAKKIERVQAVSKNSVDDIKDIEPELLKQLNNHQDFKVHHVIDKKGIHTSMVSENIDILFSDSKQWQYQLANKLFNIEAGLDLNEIFEGKWNENVQCIEVSFEDFQDNQTALISFKHHETKQLKIHQWGHFNAQFENIPIAPNKESQKKWFMALLYNQIRTQNKYILSDELEQIWNHLFYNTPQISRLGEIMFNNKQIIKHYSKDDPFYWQLQTGNDLNPFHLENNTPQQRKIIIEKKINQDLTTVLNPLGLEKAQKLTIIDRYINTKRHFEIIFMLAAIYEHLEISIVSLENHQQSDKEFIDKGCATYSINRQIKRKQNIPHDRHWKMDGHIFLVSKSIDFIKLNPTGSCNTQHTIFTPLSFSEIEKQAQDLLGEY